MWLMRPITHSRVVEVAVCRCGQSVGPDLLTWPVVLRLCFRLPGVLEIEDKIEGIRLTNYTVDGLVSLHRGFDHLRLAVALRCGPPYGQHPIQPLFSLVVSLLQTQQMLRPFASSCILEPLLYQSLLLDS
jgi:hypothetical protein